MDSATASLQAPAVGEIKGPSRPVWGFLGEDVGRLHAALPWAAPSEPVSMVRVIQQAASYIELCQLKIRQMEAGKLDDAPMEALLPPDGTVCAASLVMKRFLSDSGKEETLEDAQTSLLRLLPGIEVRGFSDLIQLVIDKIKILRHAHGVLLQEILARQSASSTSDGILHLDDQAVGVGLKKPRLQFIYEDGRQPPLSPLSSPSSPPPPPLAEEPGTRLPSSLKTRRVFVDKEIDMFCRDLVTRLENFEVFSAFRCLFKESVSSPSLTADHSYVLHRVASELVGHLETAYSLYCELVLLLRIEAPTPPILSRPDGDVLAKAASGGYGQNNPFQEWVEALIDIAFKGYVDANPGVRPAINHAVLAARVHTLFVQLITRVLPNFRNLIADHHERCWRGISEALRSE